MHREGTYTNGVSNNVEVFTTSRATTAYRSVSVDEYRDVLVNGFRPGQNSYSTGKLFANSIRDANMYNKAFGNNIILKVRIPSGLSIEKLLGVDGLDYIYNIGSESLYKVKVLTVIK